MNMDHEEVELAHGVLGELPKTGFLELMDSMYEKGKITSDSEVYDSFDASYLYRMQSGEPEGLVQTEPRLDHPYRKKYSLSSLGEEVYEVVREYRPEVDGLETVLETFSDESVDWTGFILEVEENAVVGDALDIDHAVSNRYGDKARDLGLVEETDMTSVDRHEPTLRQLTEKGETVQEFIEETVEAVSGIVDDKQDSPAWEL